jgi:TonB family protein
MENSGEYSYLHARPHIGLAVILSVAVHVGAIVALLFWPSSQVTAGTERERAIVTRLVKLGKELDPKLLPRLESQVPVQDQSTININREAQKPDKDQKKEEKAKKDEFAKKVASSVDRIKKMLENSSSRGEMGSGKENGSPDGDATEGTEGDIYLTQIYNYIRNNYSVPSIITEAERKTLKATIVIYIDENGRLIKVQFETRSGNIHFDNALESAVKKASPFPAPPKEKRKLYREQGIGVNFSI